MRGDDTRDRIKHAARRLFAERGIDGVSIREIVAAAGQRNVGSLHYYFRTKEALVREIVCDSARLINDRRNACLDSIENEGGPRHLREIINVLVLPTTGLGPSAEEEDAYLRFIVVLQLNHPRLFLDAIESQWNNGYDRCLAHIRRFLPDVPAPILDQRLVFAGLYISATLAAREAAFERQDGLEAFWMQTYTMSNLADTVQAMLECPISVQTDIVLPQAHSARPRPSSVRI